MGAVVHPFVEGRHGATDVARDWLLRLFFAVHKSFMQVLVVPAGSGSYGDQGVLMLRAHSMEARARRVVPFNLQLAIAVLAHGDKLLTRHLPWDGLWLSVHIQVVVARLDVRVSSFVVDEVSAIAVKAFVNHLAFDFSATSF